MTYEDIYLKIIGHNPNKEYGVQGAFTWSDIESLMQEAVKNYTVLPILNDMINKKRHITIWTFEHFWDIFHYKNNVRQIDKTRCRNLWNSCNFSGRKKVAINDVDKTELSAYEYLKIKLK